jgi:catabolite regulation protein CreA
MNNFLVSDVMAVSCAVQRLNKGFVKKGEDLLDHQKSNSSFLYEHFCEGTIVTVSDEDKKLGAEVVEYLQGLGFKALERNLSDFERKVLALVTSDTVDKTTLGIAASLPNVYLNKVKSDDWSDRERELGRTSDFVGVESTRCEFVATVEFMRYIPSTGSHLVTCSVEGKHIVKFFMPEAKTKVGKTYTLVGFVKPHSTNKHTGFKETMINRIKFQE